MLLIFYLCSLSLQFNTDGTHYLCLDNDNDGDVTVHAFQSEMYNAQFKKN